LSLALTGFGETETIFEKPLIMIDEIKALCAKLAVKKDFVEELANELDMSPKSVHNNWLSGYWSIPVKFQPLVKQRLEEKLKTQKATA
jgi:hypothetical protein